MGLKRDGKWILRCVFAVCLALCGAKPLSAATELFHDLPGKPVAQRVLYRWDDNPPTRFSWGQYRIEIKHYDLDDVRLFILNPMGRVVEQINAAGINEVGLIQLSGRSPSELYVQARPSSNIQSLRRAYYFTQTPRVHCFLTTVKAFDAIHRLQDGRILCAVESAAPMEWLSDLAHAQDPHMVIIGELRGERFLMRTRQYPRFSMREALLYQKRLLAAPSDPGTAWEGAPSDTTLIYKPSGVAPRRALGCVTLSLRRDGDSSKTPSQKLRRVSVACRKSFGGAIVVFTCWTKASNTIFRIDKSD